MEAHAEGNIEDLWGPYREEIAQRLNRDRPARYSQKDQGWMEPTIAWARARMPADEVTLLRLAARDEVIKAEKNSNRKANGKLRKWATGQSMLYWTDLGPLPFTIDRHGLRVRFDAATPEDIELHAKNIRADARQRYRAELAVAEGLEWLAQRARSAGYERVAMVGDMPLREDGRLTDLDWDDERDDDD